MITEDYVSCETAKLLKEKGFDENCAALYHLRTGEIIQQGVGYVFKNSQWENFVSAPTLQMAMKWIRETYKLYMYAAFDGMEEVWFSRIYDKVKHLKDLDGFNTYEEACEAAIRYCLENLI